MNKQIRKTKVVTQNILVDIISKFQNFIGINLNFYENMINKGIDDIEQELKADKIKMKWYRYEISQLTNGAIVIVYYGEAK